MTPTNLLSSNQPKDVYGYSTKASTFIKKDNSKPLSPMSNSMKCQNENENAQGSYVMMQKRTPLKEKMGSMPPQVMKA